MQNLVWKIVFILVILAFCLVVVYPPDQKLKLGKDLRGGTSLIYKVNIDKADADKQRILTQTIEVLKDRVNPQGVLDISMQPLGLDRIEIVMPLPSAKVRELRQKYEQALAELVASAEIDPLKLDEALQYNRAEQEFGGAERAMTISRLQEAYNALQSARQARDAAKAASASSEEMSRLEFALAQAEVTYDQLHRDVLSQSLEQSRIVRMLNLSTQSEAQLDSAGKPAIDSQTGQPSKVSQRDVALTALKQEFPHLAGQLDKVVAEYDTYRSARTGFDDPEDLIRLLRGAGVLEFHIAVQPSKPEGVNVEEQREQLAEFGPDNTKNQESVRWYPVNDLKQWVDDPSELATLQADPAGFFALRRLVGAEYDGQYYLLLRTSKNDCMTHEATRWSLEAARPSQDQLGRPAVAFQLDPAGGQLMSRMTGAHVNEPMAIVLDGQVYSAPNLKSQIGNSGIIEGEFSPSELNYLLRVLAAGALEARLSDRPIAINTLGPALGADNLQRGLWAFVLAVIVTVSIMMVYYFLAGFVANIALICNAIIIFGVMALMEGTFTLPGLAGIALSIAMAVDANVLIYERIREEVVNNKENLRTAIRLGYSRAMSAIIDGNLTNLIVGVVLYVTATTEVKGFALTMILGIIATLFTALFVTRVLFTIYTEYLGARTLPMLPTVFPGIHRMLEPRIDWFSKRYVFFAVSGVAAVLSLSLVFIQGRNMLDTEFRGGLSMTMQTRLANPGEPADDDGRLLLSRPEVEAKVHEIGNQAGATQPILVPLQSASVLTVGHSQDFKASRFQIKVGNPQSAAPEETVVETVVNAIVKRFGDDLDVQQPLTFAGQGSTAHNERTFPITNPELGANIQRPQYRSNVREYLGGVAVVVDELDPPVNLDDVTNRVKRMREQPDFRDTGGRSTAVIGLQPADPNDPAKGYTSIAVVVADPAVNFSKVDFGIWDSRLAAREWNLVAAALERPASLEQVSEFSSAVAETLRAKAIVAVTLSLLGMLAYLWIRFGSLRYSAATVVAVTFNVIFCLGALALTHWIGGSAFASWLLMDEYWIDLNVIAALLTIIGYSLNDTIVILDRIRENRGKRLLVTPEIVNNSINQTFSRTILTGGSTIIASIILYIVGGTGIQPFAFTFLIGLVVGTYSSVTIAAPLVIGGPPASEPSPPTAQPIKRLAHPAPIST
jgi:SecD/SecF fusion protein